MKKVLIIEDELLSAKRLKKMILDIDDTLEVDGPFTAAVLTSRLTGLLNPRIAFSH